MMLSFLLLHTTKSPCRACRSCPELFRPVLANTNLVEPAHLDQAILILTTHYSPALPLLSSPCLIPSPTRYAAPAHPCLSQPVLASANQYSPRLACPANTHHCTPVSGAPCLALPAIPIPTSIRLDRTVPLRITPRLLLHSTPHRNAPVL